MENRPVIRNVATPASDYDVANKKYVDDNTANPTLHLVDLNLDGSVNLSASSLIYDTIKSNLSNPKRTDYLDCFWENGQGTNSFTRFKANAVGISDVNNGDVMFEGELFYLGIPIWIVFTLSPQNVLTTVAVIRREDTANKVQSITSNSTSTVKYPSTKAVFDEFQRKPVVVYSDSTGLAAIGANMSASPAWQLTNLDLTPYRRIKIWTKAAQKSGSTASASTTPTTCLEMMLDPTLAISAYGNHYLASNIIQKSNDNNRLATLTCAVSADKTSFVVLRQTNLYGTAATDNTDVGSNVVLIEGYYD